MSTGSSEKSTTASQQAIVNSVYDFLYYDSQRIGSFLGQFDPDGLLQSRKRVAGIGRSSQDKSNHAIKGGIPTVVGAEGAYENQVGERYDKSAEHTYDPLWANALQFLEYLEDKNLISRKITESKLGQFVLYRGSLLINDMALLKAMAENSTLRRWLATGLDDTKPSGPRQTKGQPTSEAELVLSLIPILPPLIQATISSEETNIWSALNPNQLLLPTGDLMLKHGSTIAGEWSILGILDAFPDFMNTSNRSSDSDLNGAMGNFANLLRPIVGRPSGHYGITPLIIFREVSTANS